MTSDEYLSYFYPFLSVALDPRYVTPQNRATALQLATAKTPFCETVPEASEQRKEAIAHYAAYLLNNIYQQNLAGGGVVAGMVLKREKEGDVEREWTAQTNVDLTNATQGPDSPFELWQAVAGLCPQVSPFKLRTVRI